MTLEILSLSIEGAKDRKADSCLPSSLSMSSELSRVGLSGERHEPIIRIKYSIKRSRNCTCSVSTSHSVTFTPGLAVEVGLLGLNCPRDFTTSVRSVSVSLCRMSPSDFRALVRTLLVESVVKSIISMSACDR